jgi:tetratricopeptide (TPR) repeat protein
MLALNFIAWVLFFRLAYKAMNLTSQGFLKVSEYPDDQELESNLKPYKLMLMFILLGIAIALVFNYLGRVAGYCYLVLAILTLPASIMIIDLENSVFAALNPFQSIHIISSIGWPYMVMFGFLFVLYSSQGIATQWVINTQLPVYSATFSPADMANYLGKMQKSAKWLVLNASFISMYFTMIMFNMIGYVLYQYHKELGLDVSKHQVEPVEAEIAHCIGRGDINTALKIARKELGKDDSNLAANDRYLKLLMLSAYPEQTLTHAQNFITALLEQKKAGKAVEVYENMLNINADFQPTHDTQVLPIAQAATAIGKAKTALRIMDKFEKRFPLSNETPEVYLYAAKLLCEEFEKYPQARQTLLGVLQKYPQHPKQEEVRSYLNLIEQLEKGQYSL